MSYERLQIITFIAHQAYIHQASKGRIHSRVNVGTWKIDIIKAGNGNSRGIW